MAVVHLLDPCAQLPACRRPDRASWSWTLTPAAVTCPDCRRADPRQARDGEPQPRR